MITDQEFARFERSLNHKLIEQALRSDRLALRCSDLESELGLLQRKVKEMETGAPAVPFDEEEMEDTLPGLAAPPISYGDEASLVTFTIEGERTVCTDPDKMLGACDQNPFLART